MAKIKKDKKNVVTVTTTTKSKRPVKAKTPKNCKKKDVPVKKTFNRIKRKYKEKEYSCDTVEKALNAIEAGHTLRQASRIFGVPKSTLHAKLNNHVPLNCVKGAPTFFTKEEESMLAEWILYLAERGFPVTKSVLLDRIQEWLISEKRENPFKDNRPGKYWYTAFMRRHPNLSNRIAQNLTTSRAAVTEDDLRTWFHSVHNYLENKDLLNLTPDWMLVPKDNAVITRKGAKSVYQFVAGNEKACLTVLFTVAASGVLLPPMVLFDLKTTPKKNVLNEIPEGWSVGHSDRGWMTSETFYNYIVNVFYNWLLDKKYEFPVILYVDGHSSHLTLPLMKFCNQVNIEIIALYPNATHILQPLDVAVFHPLKEAYKKTLRIWRIENDVVDFKKSMFAKVLKLAIDSVDLSDTIKNGFKACGLHPFNENAVNYNILDKKKIDSKVSSSSSSNRSQMTANTVSNLQILQVFETYVVSPELLDKFRNNETEEWRDDVSQRGLFESWIKLKKQCENNEDQSRANVSDNGNIEENISIVTISPNDSISNLSTAKSVTESDEIVEENSLASIEAHIMPSDVQILNLESFEESNQFEAMEVVLEIDLNPSSSDNDHYHDLRQRLTASSIPFTLEASNNSNINVNTPISEDHALNPNILSTVVSMEEQSTHFNENTASSFETNKTLYNELEDSPADIEATNTVNTEQTDTNVIMDEMINPVNEMRTSDEFNNLIDDALDLSVDSNGTSAESKQTVKDFETFKNVFPVPTFNKKSKTKSKSKGSPPAVVSTRDDMLKVLEKKETEKKLKDQQIWQNKKEKERIRKLKEKENSVNKDFQERKKKLIQEKEINFEIKNLKKILKSKSEKENKTELLTKQKNLCARLEQLDRLLVSHEMDVLQQKIKIKQEKL